MLIDAWFHKYRSHLLAVVCFLFLSLLLVGPALFGGGRKVCAEPAPDTFIHMWAFWRMDYALSGQDVGYIMSHAITYPCHIFEVSAVFDSLLLWMSIPLQWIVSDVTTVFNWLVLLGLVFTGYSGYLLTGRFADNKSAGLVGGTIAMANPYLYRQIAGGFIEFAWWGLLLMALHLWLCCLDRPRRGLVIAYVITLWALALMSIYLAAWYALLSALWLTRAVWRRATARPHQLWRGLRLHGIALACLLPLLLFWTHQLSLLGFRGMPHGRPFPLADVHEAQKDLVASRDKQNPDERVDDCPNDAWIASRALIGSMDVADLARPGGRWAVTRRKREPKPGRLAPAYVLNGDAHDRVFGGEWVLVLLLAAFAWRDRDRHRQQAQWVAVGLLFLILALGPVPVVNGQTGLHAWLPYAWFYQWLPGFSRLMVPARAVLVAITVLGALAARGSVALVGRLPSRIQALGKARVHGGVAIVCFLAFLLTGYDGISLPVTDADVPPLYEQLRDAPGRFALLELPTDRNIDPRMYYQSVHNRPIYGGLPPIFMCGEPDVEIVATNALVAAIDRQDPTELPSDAIRQAANELAAIGFGYLVLQRDGYANTQSFDRVSTDLTDAIGGPALTGDGIAAWRLDHASEKPHSPPSSPH